MPLSLGNCVFLSFLLFLTLSLSLSFLSLTEYFRNEISPEAISYMKETVHCAKKALGSGADDTEGSMIVRENVYEEEK